MPDELFLRLQAELAGRYALEGELGRGGMGVVYLARDLAPDRPVAIKLLAPALAAQPAHRERFLREARTAARLSHPHIVPIHAVESHGDLVLFVMGYVEGETLGERVARAGPLAPAEALRVLQEVAWALAYAHRHGVIHRDVKPDNILLERGSGRALVADFGIALAAGGPPPGGPAAVAGTPRYMSPEQAAGAAVDGRSDLYSLGLVACYALTGAPGGGSLIAAGPAASVDPILRRCLDPDPDHRFASGEDLASALGDARGFTPVVPQAVRRFLDVFATFTLEVSSYLAIVLVLVGWMLALGEGGAPLFTHVVVYAGFVMAGLFGLRSAQLVGSARGLLAEGFDASDVRRALERRDEPDPLPPGRPRSAWRAVLALASGAAWVLAAGWWMGSSRGVLLDGLLFAVLTLYPVVLLRSLLGRLFAPSRRGPWARFWGRIFDWKVFGLAGLGAGKRPRLVTDRTEVALGEAMRELLDALPPAIRMQLPELPDLASRLEAQVDGLRRLPGEESVERRRTALLALEAATGGEGAVPARPGRGLSRARLSRGRRGRQGSRSASR